MWSRKTSSKPTPVDQTVLAVIGEGRIPGPDAVCTEATVLTAAPRLLWAQTFVDLLVVCLHWLRVRQGQVLRGKLLWLWSGQAENDGFCDKLRLDQRCTQQPLLLDMNLCFQYSKGT